MSNIVPVKCCTRSRPGKSRFGPGGPDILIFSFIIIVGKYSFIPLKSFKKFIIASFKLKTLAVAWLSIHIHEMCLEFCNCFFDLSQCS